MSHPGRGQPGSTQGVKSCWSPPMQRWGRRGGLAGSGAGAQGCRATPERGANISPGPGATACLEQSLLWHQVLSASFQARRRAGGGAAAVVPAGG